MTGPNQSAQVQGSYHASALVVPPRPDEVGFPLRQDEYETLCEGELSEARANRDLSFGIFVGACVGLCGVLATTDWSTIWQPEKRWPFLAWSVVLLTITVASGIAAIIYHWRLRRTRTNSPYSRLTKKITAWFEAQQDVAVPSAVQGVPAKPSVPAVLLSELRFDRPGSPMDQWHFTSDDATNKTAPIFSAPDESPGGLRMTAPGTHHIDLKVEAKEQRCNRLLFRTKPRGDCPESYVYANVRAASSDGKLAKAVWIACDVGDKTPATHGPDECIIFRTQSPDGWATFDLSLPEEILRSPFGKQGLRFAELLGIRVRGSISVSPIGFYLENISG
jgi:hypothetical protein